jgi:hypothetical protein
MLTHLRLRIGWMWPTWLRSHPQKLRRFPNSIYYLYPIFLQCFKKNLCTKLGDLFLKWPSQEFFWKSNRADGKRHCQLALIPNFSQFWHTMTKIITHLNANFENWIWKLEHATCSNHHIFLLYTKYSIQKLVQIQIRS